MVVEFTIENFRSIKNEQLLSFYAENKPKYHAGNISYIDNKIGILKTCAIYGSNASGKTNIILAFKALVSLITESGDWKDGDGINCYEPYLLSQTTADKPTSFEIEFYIDGLRYIYQIKFNGSKILFEKLDVYLSARPANLFTRTSPDDWKAVKFGEHYKEGKKQIAFFPNNTYLAKAGNSADSPEIVRKIFNYFRKNTVTMLTNQTISILDWEEDEQTSLIVNTFLKKVDLGINKFKMEKDKSVKDIPLPDDFPEELKEKILNDLSKKAFFYHETDYGELLRFNNSQESSGTTKLFKLLPFIINVLHKGSIVFIDEIEGSLHPHIAELLIKLFNDPLVNKNNAQLIFTTHDLSLMTSKTMRKDQIYLTKKSVEEGTSIDCLESYDLTLKDNSPFDKWYNEGRLGAIPTINYRDISDSIKKMF